MSKNFSIYQKVGIGFLGTLLLLTCYMTLGHFFALKPTKMTHSQVSHGMVGKKVVRCGSKPPYYKKSSL